MFVVLLYLVSPIHHNCMVAYFLLSKRLNLFNCDMETFASDHCIDERNDQDKEDNQRRVWEYICLSYSI